MSLSILTESQTDCIVLSKDRLTIEEMKNMEEGGAKVASSMIWAIALIIIVGVVAGALYYGGILSGKTEKKVDVEISVPTR